MGRICVLNPPKDGKLTLILESNISEPDVMRIDARGITAYIENSIDAKVCKHCILKKSIKEKQKKVRTVMQRFGMKPWSSDLEESSGGTESEEESEEESREESEEESREESDEESDEESREESEEQSEEESEEQSEEQSDEESDEESEGE